MTERSQMDTVFSQAFGSPFRQTLFRQPPMQVDYGIASFFGDSSGHLMVIAKVSSPRLTVGLVWIWGAEGVIDHQDRLAPGHLNLPNDFIQAKGKVFP